MSPAREPIETVEAAGGWLESLINFERSSHVRYERFDLRAIRALLERLGHPGRELSVVHWAGSKGKGSTALLTEFVLGALGERVGTFTSPHLVSWTERFRVAGEPVDGAALARAVERVRPAVEQMRDEDARSAPTFFDATTAAALVLFEEAGLDRAILEVGLGGRLDSTNVVSPAVTGITSIELEHTDKLGDTLGAIATEKAGILKPSVPCVMGRLPDEARYRVRDIAAERDVPLWEDGRDFRTELEETLPDGRGVRFRYEDRDGCRLSAELPLLGDHQIHNAGLALAAVRRLACHASDEVAAAARRGFATAVLPGRAEVLSREPWVVVDAAHTEASAAALRRALDALPALRRHWVLSVSGDKDPVAVLNALLRDGDVVHLTRAEPRRSLDPQTVAAAARSAAPSAEIRVVPNPHLAVRAAREALGERDLLVASGSIYLAGIAREILLQAGSRNVAVSRGRRSAPSGPRSGPPSGSR